MNFNVCVRSLKPLDTVKQCLPSNIFLDVWISNCSASGHSSTGRKKISMPENQSGTGIRRLSPVPDWRSRTPGKNAACRSVNYITTSLSSSRQNCSRRAMLVVAVCIVNTTCAEILEQSIGARITGPPGYIRSDAGGGSISWLHKGLKIPPWITNGRLERYCCLKGSLKEESTLHVHTWQFY